MTTQEKAQKRLGEIELRLRFIEPSDGPEFFQLCDEARDLRYDLKYTCRCGRVGEAEDRFDARGIYLMRCCEVCWKTEKKKYRSDVLTDPGYWADEPIEED